LYLSVLETAHDASFTGISYWAAVPQPALVVIAPVVVVVAMILDLEIRKSQKKNVSRGNFDFKFNRGFIVASLVRVSLYSHLGFICGPFV
jgi:hypothetical protein